MVGGGDIPLRVFGPESGWPALGTRRRGGSIPPQTVQCCPNTLRPRLVRRPYQTPYQARRFS